MGVSKFYVYNLLVLLLFVEQSVSGYDQLWNNDNEFASRERNCRTLYKRRSAASMNSFSMAPSDMSQVHARGDEPAPKTQSDNSSQNSDTNDKDKGEFHFLVTGGYRHENDDLVKFLVSIRHGKTYKFFGDNHYCGGCLISKTVVLTAAHCLVNSKNQVMSSRRFKVVAGTPRRLLETSNTQELQVKEVKPHENYIDDAVHDDVGLLILQDKVQTDGSTVDIIPLADEDPPAGLECTIIGWGVIFEGGPLPDEAVRADLTILSNDYCYTISEFGTGMICASNPENFEVDSCQGDSGGPLFCEGKVFGVVSFGEGCGRPDTAGVYADVYYYREWIELNAATCPLASWFRLPLITLAMQQALRAHCL
ncbi:trypsin eta-like [Drosophila montana]|uniref:trypsin eta-like n=1 Tax=Drosophila montana TaxID=40370 RepID=UPI00313DE4AE